MVGNVPPQGPQSSQPPDSGIPLPAGYRGEFVVSPEFKKMWTSLFHGQPLGDKEIAKMTEQFINQVWNQCNVVLQHALQNLKDLEAQRKEAEGT